MNQTVVLLILAVVAMLTAFVVFIALLFIFRLWIRALLSGAPVQVFAIIGMRLRGSPAGLLINAHIALKHSHVPVSIGEVESIYLANKARVLTAADLVSLVAAEKSRAAAA